MENLVITIDEIPGWFDFGNIYDQAILAASDGAHFVECGVYCGRSTIYMADQIKKSNKNIRFDAIDSFDPGKGFAVTTQMFEHFASVFGVRDKINLIVDDQFKVIPTYEDNSLDLVFLDSDHSYEGTKLAIELFKSKVKSSGILAGHDYTREFPGVIKAVRETLPKASCSNSSFIWIKP